MTNFKENDMSCRNCKYWNECQTEFIVYASTAPIDRKTIHCINWTPKSDALLICNKADICGLEYCDDKKPHKETSYCADECRWHGVCVPYEISEIRSQNTTEAPYWLKSHRHG